MLKSKSEGADLPVVRAQVQLKGSPGSASLREERREWRVRFLGATQHFSLGQYLHNYGAVLGGMYSSRYCHEGTMSGMY